VSITMTTIWGPVEASFCWEHPTKAIINSRMPIVDFVKEVMIRPEVKLVLISDTRKYSPQICRGKGIWPML
jgi:hypothetical protein